MRDWDDHRLILTLHRCGTLRAAGDALGVTHTTIARRLAALENHEPSPVFERQGRAYRATAYGLERVALAERIEELDYTATRIQRGSQDNLSGPVSLSIPQAVLQYLLLDEINDFVRTYPDIELTITGTDKLADLDRGEADVVIRGHATPPDHLVGRQICTVGINHYANRAYLTNTPEKEYRWITASEKSDWISKTTYPNCPSGLVIHDIQSRFLALKNGLGLSRAACFMADSEPSLVKLDDNPSAQIYGLWVLTHPDLRSSPKIQALMKSMSEGLSQKKTQIQG